MRPADVARQTPVSEASLREWRHDPTFAAEVSRLQAEDAEPTTAETVLRELAATGKTDRIRLDAAKELARIERERRPHEPTDPHELVEHLAGRLSEAMAALQ